MKNTVNCLFRRRALLGVWAVLFMIIMVLPPHVGAQTPPAPVVAVHVSEQTEALEAIPGVWWTSWHYFVIPESLKEALRSDGTPFVTVTDADIAAGKLLYPDGSPRYPIVVSLAAEAIADNESAPLRSYVAAGGILFSGSSAFTRSPDSTERADFALANEMGLHRVAPGLANWYQNETFTKVLDHRLVAGIPDGTLTWRMPLYSEQIPLGVSPDHEVHGSHWVFQVAADAGTTVIANGDSGPLLASRQYGKGVFIYHGAAQPLIGHGGYDSSMYAYLIYRNAIEWAFEAARLPVVKLSPWRYGYDAAYFVRHDFENTSASIRSVESSAAFESSVGAKGDYYFCTGTLREEMADKDAVIPTLRNAIASYGASIGSHNGGLKNPVNPALLLGDFDYWHWGPDEALDVTTFPTGSYTSGREYAKASILQSFQDIEGWFAGVDNGRVAPPQAPAPACGLPLILTRRGKTPSISSKNLAFSAWVNRRSVPSRIGPSQHKPRGNGIPI